MSERMSDEDFNQIVEEDWPGDGMEQLTALIKEARRARESEARLEKDNLAHRTALMTTAMWMGLEEERDAATQRAEKAENLAQRLQEAAWERDSMGEKLDAAIQRAEKSEADLKWLRESVIRAPFRSQRDAALERVRVLTEAARWVVEQAYETEDGQAVVLDPGFLRGLREAIALANLSSPSTVKGDDKPGQTPEGEKP